jgi:hypothetical protein
MSATDDFQQFVDQVKEAMRQVITGNPAPLKALYSHSDDVTVFVGFGAYERGWEEVGHNAEWASARFRGGSVTFETLAMGMSGDLAYPSGLKRARYVWPIARNSAHSQSE